MTRTQIEYLGDRADLQEPAVAAPRSRPLLARRAEAFFRPESVAPIYTGAALCVAGFVVLGVGWLQVALLRDVWKQMPYLLSAGFPGIGLILVGLVMVNVTVRRRDAAVTRQQLADVAEAIRQSRPRGARR